MMTYTLPIDPNTTAFDELIPAVLLRGCKGHVTHADIKRRCEQLYGASLEYYYSYFGDHLMVNFCADFLSDKAVGGDVNILRSMIELMARVWCDPVLDENGLLRADEIAKTKVSFRMQFSRLTTTLRHMHCAGHVRSCANMNRADIAFP